MRELGNSNVITPILPMQKCKRFDNLADAAQVKKKQNQGIKPLPLTVKATLFPLHYPPLNPPW